MCFSGKEECPLSASEIIQASILADLCLTSRKENRIVTVWKERKTEIASYTVEHNTYIVWFYLATYLYT